MERSQGLDPQRSTGQQQFLDSVREGGRVLEDAGWSPDVGRGRLRWRRFAGQRLLAGAGRALANGKAAARWLLMGGMDDKLGLPGGTWIVIEIVLLVV